MAPAVIVALVGQRCKRPGLQKSGRLPIFDCSGLSISDTNGIRWSGLTGLAIDALLADRPFGFDVERAIYLTVLHLMVSGSDRHASRRHQGFRIHGAEGRRLITPIGRWPGSAKRLPTVAPPRMPPTRISIAVGKGCSARYRSPSSTPCRCTLRVTAGRRHLPPGACARTVRPVPPHRRGRSRRRGRR